MAPSIDLRIPVLSALIYLLALSAYSIAYTENHTVDVSFYIQATQRYCVNCTGIYLHESPYDGVFYYLISKDPLNTEQLKGVIPDSSRSYRHQRILYPLIVHMLSFGKTELIPYIMVSVNILCVILSTVILQCILAKNKKPLWYAAYVPFIPGIFSSVRLNLAEPLWVLLIITSVYLSAKRMHVHSASVLFLAALTRETAFLFILPLIAYHLIFKKYKTAGVYATILPAFFVWQLILFQATATLPIAKSSGLLNDPLWLLRGYPTIHQIPTYILIASIPLMLWISAQTYRKKPTPTSFIFLANALLAFVLLTHSDAWFDTNSSSRAILPVTLSALLSLSESDNKKIHYVLIPQAMLTMMIMAYSAYLVMTLL
jgi:hypothetical protein